MSSSPLCQKRSRHDRLLESIVIVPTTKREYDDDDAFVVASSRNNDDFVVDDDDDDGTEKTNDDAFSENKNVPSDKVIRPSRKKRKRKKWKPIDGGIFKLIEFTKRRMMLCLVVIKTIVVDAWRGIGWALKTRVAKFVLSAAFFIGSGAGLRREHASASAQRPAGEEPRIRRF